MFYFQFAALFVIDFIQSMFKDGTVRVCFPQFLLGIKKVIKKVQCIAIWVWDLCLEIVNLCLIDHYEHNNIRPGHILRFAS